VAHFLGADTGELYAMCEYDGRGIVFDRLFSTEREVEHLLRDWAEAPLRIGCMLNTEAVELREPLR
jgi:hypothetical protein